MPPRVGISLLTLVPGLSGGSETYVRGLAEALGRVGELEYRVLLPRIAADVQGLPAEIVPEYRASRSTPGRIVAMSVAALRGGPLRRHLAGLDCVHFPLSVMIPPVSTPPAASSVLDVQHEELPEFFSLAERQYRRLVYGWTLRRSRLVVTISHHAARALVERLGVPEKKLRPIHLGIDHRRYRPDGSERRDLLLYPAREWPHKNHPRLFEAFAVLRDRHPSLELVLTAYRGPTPPGVRALGDVPVETRVELYRTARALVFPSLYEGFGQPPLEAMACGCPVACSNAASLPEVCGDAAALFDPRSVEEMVEAVEEVLAQPDHWGALGLARAAGFTWEATARAHDAVYRELAA
jgi:glycosyltransferase involved in cell wall biosynthesis